MTFKNVEARRENVDIEHFFVGFGLECSRVEGRSPEPPIAPEMVWGYGPAIGRATEELPHGTV